MGKIKKYIAISELKPGMIIAEEIRLENTVLVSAGTVATDILISKLKKILFFSQVAVLMDEKYEAGQFAADKQKSVEDIEQCFSEFSFNVEGLFNNLNGKGISNIDEIRSFARKIQQELHSTRAIIKNIVLYGSDNDVIFRHSVNVAALSSLLGRWIGLSDKDINLLTYSAILHDFGKTKIDKDILNKSGVFTSKEYQIMKIHPIIGYDMLKGIQFLDSSISYGVLMHHERLDGSGYPLGIKEDRIHTFPRIIAIADIFDAVNSNRVHRKSKRPFEALQIIQKESLGKLDYEFCKIFIEHVVNYYIGESVQLNTDKICKIIQINTNDLERPLLFDGSEFIDLKQQKDLYIEKLML